MLSLKHGSEEDLTFGLGKVRQLDLDILGIETGRPEGRQAVVGTQRAHH